MTQDTREAERIREDIEQTREELGETVEALADKADVKAHAKAKVDETKEQVKERATTDRRVQIGLGVGAALLVLLVVRRARE